MQLALTQKKLYIYIYIYIYIKIIKIYKNVHKGAQWLKQVFQQSFGHIYHLFIGPRNLCINYDTVVYFHK